MADPSFFLRKEWEMHPPPCFFISVHSKGR